MRKQKKDHGEATIDLLVAAKAIVERDVDLGLVSTEQLKWVFADRVERPDVTIRWDCRALGCYVKETLPDWAMLDGCFGETRIRASDIDGVVHQNGKCLFLEKKYIHGCLEPPQVRAIETLVGQGNSVIAFWCSKTDGSDTMYMRVWGVPGYSSQERFEASIEDVRTAVKTWFDGVYEDGKI
jgi:hypothetical protein